MREAPPQARLCGVHGGDTAQKSYNAPLSGHRGGKPCPEKKSNSLCGSDLRPRSWSASGIVRTTAGARTSSSRRLSILRRASRRPEQHTVHAVRAGGRSECCSAVQRKPHRPSAVQADGGDQHDDARAGGRAGDRHQPARRPALAVCPGGEKTNGSVTFKDTLTKNQGEE